MKKLFKRLAIAALTAATLAMSVFPAFAEDGDWDVDAGGHGGHNGPSTIWDCYRIHGNWFNEGFRVYIVNNKGVPVSNIVDFVQYYPYDNSKMLDLLLKSKTAGEVSLSDFQWMFGYLGSGPNKGGTEYRPILYTGGARTDDWYGRAEGKIYWDGREPVGEAGVSSITRTNFENKFSSTGLSATSGKMYTIEELELALYGLVKDDIGSYPFNRSYTRAEYVDPETKESCETFNKILPGLVAGIDTGMSTNTVEQTGIYTMNYFMRPVDIEHYDTNSKRIIDYFLDLVLPDHTGTGIVAGGSKPLFEFLKSDIQSYYNDAKAKYQALSADQKKVTRSPMAQTAKQFNLRVAFEPVAWDVPGAGCCNLGTTIKTPPLNEHMAFSYNQATADEEIYWQDDTIFYGTPYTYAYYVADKLREVVTADPQEGTKNAPALNAPLSDWIAWMRTKCFVVTQNNGYTCTTYHLTKGSYDLAPLDKDTPEVEEYVLDYMLEQWQKVGYGVMYLSVDKSEGSTPTWDKEKFPEDSYKPGPSPENTNPDGSPKEPQYPSEGDNYQVPGPDGKKKDHNFNIVKFYAEKEPDGSYVYEENYTRNQAIHDITINDEPGYTVDNYFTSPTFQQPSPTNGPSTQSYDTFKSTLPKGSKEGTKAEHITVEASSTDTTLYLRLVKTPMLTVKKLFPDGSTKVEVIPWQPSYDPTEPGQIYKSDKQEKTTPDPLPGTWPETTGTPETNPNITVQPTTRTLYILYDGGPGTSDVITLEQNELAHTFTLADIHDLLTLKHTFDDKYQTKTGYKHHDNDYTWYHSSDSCGGHVNHSGDFTCYWYTAIVDENWSYTIENPNNYGSTSFVGSTGPFTPVETGRVTESGTFGINGGTTPQGLEPNLKFSIYRDKSKDQATLYPEKNNSVKSVLSHIGITQEGYEPKTHRAGDKGSTQWYSTFKVQYAYTASTDNKLSYHWVSDECTRPSSHSPHTGNIVWEGTETPLTLATLNSTFSKSNNVLTKAYYGQPGKGDKVTELSKQAFNLPGLTRVPSTATFGASGHNATQTFQKSSDNIYFGLYPFVKYVYQTVDNTSDTPAFITSTNLSEIRDNTTVEMGVYYSMTGATNRYAIGLTSEQWSTHARTIEGLTSQNVPAAERNKSLLPGGATVDLRTANTDSSLPESWIGVRIYQTAMPDDLQKTYTQTTQSNTNLKTVSEVQNDVNTFFENLKSILSGYQLEKWAKEGIYLNDSDLDTGATKVSGINPATSLAGNNLSRDSKYYLKEGVSADAADASHIDVIRSDQAVNVYTVSSDTEGKIVVKKNNSVIAQTTLTSTNKQSAINALLSNAEVKRVDDHVKFVTNFITSLDFNEGSDRTGRTWYTEAHDGFAAVEAFGAFQIGFGSASDGTGVGGGAPVRSEVVDPRLTGKLDSKSDVLNFTPATLNEKSRTLQYRTSNRSTSPLASSKPDGYMGTFDGIDIIMPNTNTLLRSKLHYLSNVTVQDLN